MPRCSHLVFAVAFLSLLAAPLRAQTISPPQRPGRLVGRVIDAGSGDAIPGVHVALEGTSYVARTDLTGRYTITDVIAGTYTLSLRVIGYTTKTITDVVVDAGAVAQLDVSLDASAIQIGAVEVTADLERGSVSRALEAQRTASHIVSSITQEQIKRSPDADASQAVQRVSGVTVQDGKYVFVRGLGERYTTTSLNSARIPSPEPERRVVPLDLFPSGLLQSITTSKTFTPDQPADFSGAQVDLQTREFPAHRVIALSTSLGMNTAVTGHDVPRAPSVGTEWLGFAGAERRLPALAKSAGNLNGLNLDQTNAIIASFRNAWSAGNAPAPANGSFAASTGGESFILGAPVGYLASLTYSNSQEIRRDETGAVAIYGGVADSALPYDRFDGATATTSVLWGGLLNVSARLGNTSRIALNNTYTRSADNQATHVTSYSEQFTQDFDLTRLTFVERAVRSTQLTGEHLFADRHAIAWSVTSSAVSRSEPDRSDLRYQAAPDPATGKIQPTRWWYGEQAAARTFSALTEDAVEGSASLTLKFGAPDHPLQLKTGGAARSVSRDADTRLYEIQNFALSDSQRAVAPEQLFRRYAADTGFILRADPNAGRYTVTDRVYAGYAMTEIPLTPHVRLVGGARVEYWDLDLTTIATNGAPHAVARRNTDVLPSIALNVRLTDKQNLRLSASQTLSRPEYRELSTVEYRDLVGRLRLQGDTGLRRALIRNLDVRWEAYPHPGETFSIALFAKLFHDPIEKIIKPTTGAPVLSFTNTEGASNYGVELEMRKQLAWLTVFANATLMRSRITVSNDTSNFTHDVRPMTGQSSYVVNAGLGYTSPNGRVSATVLYNVVGTRILEAGTAGIPDAYEQARHLVDFTLSAPLPLGLGATVKLDAKNLLDQPYELLQGSVVRSRYITGRSFSLGLAWQL